MRKLIRTDGTEQNIELPISMQDIHTLIGADGLDTVNLRHLSYPLMVMLVDDLGHPKGLPVNDKASSLYWANCIPGSEPPPIRGDVVVVPDLDF